MSYLSLLQEGTTAGSNHNRPGLELLSFQCFEFSFQYEALRIKYGKLRDEYNKSRSKTKEKLVEYLEKDAGVKVPELHGRLKAFRASVSSKHCVSQYSL